VQDKLRANASGSSRRLRGQQPSLLTGILTDSAGRAMTPSHASKGKAQRYRYYVTRPDQTNDQPAYRVSAHDLEQIVTMKLASYFAAPSQIAGLAPPDIEAHALQQALAKADLTAAALRSGSAKAKHAIITTLLSRATLHEDRIELMLDRAGLAETLALPLDRSLPSITLGVPAHRQRRGHQIRLMIAGKGMPIEPVTPSKPARDDKLIALLAEAHAARQLVLSNPEIPLAELARQQGKCRKHLSELVELSCLAPDIVEAVLAGKQPGSLTAAKLRSSSLPLSWNEQRALLLEA
jgi:hypothetical protein